MALTAAQLSDISSVAWDNVQKTIPDTLSKANYFLSVVLKNKKYKDGGETIRFPLTIAELQSKGFINGTTDVTSTNPQQTFTHGNLNWKFHYANVAVTLEDLTTTADSKHAVVDLFEGKIAKAKNSVSREWSEALHGNGTAANKSFNGLADIFAASGTAYAGLTDTDFANGDQWLTEIDSTTQVPNYANLSIMIEKLRQRCRGLYGQVSGTDYDVDIAFSNYAVRNKFASSEQNKARYHDTKKLESGFDVISINGVDWAIDGYSTGTADGSTADNHLYIVSSASMMFFYKYGFDRPSPLDQRSQILPNQPITFNCNYLSGNLACENRRVNGVFKTLVA